MMDLGIIDYLLRVKEESCFFLAEELGLALLELSVDHVGDPSRFLFDAARLNDLGRLCESTGVRIQTLYATNFVRQSLVHPDDATREPAMAALQSLAELASDQGIETIVLPLFGASEPKGAEGLATLRLVLERASCLAEETRINFALKTSLPCENLMALIGRFDSAAIGVCYDPGMAVALNRNPPSDIRLLGDRVKSIHLRDLGESGETLPLGQGKVDIPLFLEALRDVQYRGPLILDTPTIKTAVGSARKNVEYVQRLMRRLAA